MFSFLGKALTYFAWGQTYYIVDAPYTSGTSVLDIASPQFHTVAGQVRAPVIAVPSTLLQELYPKVAGRERNEELLRSLMRYAHIEVRQSNLVHPSCRGVVASKLAFLALTHNAENEMDMYKTHVPAALGINDAAKRAWAGETRRRVLPQAFVIASVLLVAYRERRRLSRLASLSAYSLGRMVGIAFKVKERYRNTVIGSAVSAGWSGLLSAPALYSQYYSTRAPFVRGSIADIVMSRGDVSDAGLFCGATVVSATAEELFKRSHPAAELSLVSLEAWHHGIEAYWPTLLVHLVCTRLRLEQGIMLHTLWNLLVCSEGRPASSQINAPDDVCVDDPFPRDNEEIAEGNTLSHIEGWQFDAQLPCRKPGKSWYFRAIGVESVQVTTYRSCSCNERAAIISRVLAVNKQENEIWRVWWRQARPMGKVPVPDYAKWLKHLPSRARGLIARDPSTSVLGGHGQEIKAFVKREKAVTAIRDTPIKKSPAPRIIQGRSVDVKIATGPFTWAYGKRLAIAYGPDQNYLYAGGRTAEEIGRFFEELPRRWGNMPFLHWIAVDCSRWDRSVGPTPMACLYDEYKNCGAPKDCLIALKGRDGKRKARSAGGWRFTRRAQVASGDGDTSGGNSRVHLVMLESCHAVCGAIVHGDDAVIYTDDPETVLRHYRQGGFDPVMAPEIDFCSGLFWPTSDGPVLGPKIGRVLAKTFHSVHFFESGNYIPWLRGVCLSLRNSCSFIPILRALIPRLLYLCGEGKVWRDDAHHYKSMASTSHSIVEETWNFMLERYGLDEADVASMEIEIRGLTIGSLLEGERWVALVHRDIVGIG
jgi:hypothetical protein